MANIFRTNEVYKSFRYDIDGSKKIVPVRGMYISGNYRPPYYNEPGLFITGITTENAVVENFQDSEVSSGVDTMTKIVDFVVETFQPSIINYSTAEASSGVDTMTKIVDFVVETFQPELEFYESTTVDAGTDTMTKILDFGVDLIQMTQPIVYGKSVGSSAPESMLRITSFSSDSAVIENYN